MKQHLASSRLTRVAFLLPLMLSTACATVRRHPVTPIPVVLVSTRPFVVHVPSSADDAAVACTVSKLRGTVATVRGDTMFLASASQARANKRLPDCLMGRAGFIVLSAHPTLRVETTQMRPGRTFGLAMILFPIGVFIGLGLAIAP